MLPQIEKLKGIALDLLFPQRCVGCGKEGNLVCASCLHSLPRIMPPICPKCGKPQTSGILCPGCTGWQTEIDGIRAPFRFDGVIREAVHQLKYNNLRALVIPLVGFLLDYMEANPVPGQVLVPVPLHPKRLKERGYNQSSLLAYRLGKLIDLPVIDNCLVRTKFVTPQARASTVAERRENVADAFLCRDRRLQNRDVILIDDVSTSGATLNACARALKAFGARSVWGLVLAREI